MVTGKWVVAAVMTGLIVVVPVAVKQARLRGIGESAPAERTSVRVEHELIPLAEDPVPAPVRHDSPAAAMRQAPPTPAKTERRLVDKARRALLGDGRHRPQPFPAAR